MTEEEREGILGTLTMEQAWEALRWISHNHEKAFIGAARKAGHPAYVWKMSRAKPAALSGARGRELRTRLAKERGAFCFYCRKPFEDPAREATFDHYVPKKFFRFVSSSVHVANLVLACGECNNAKGDTLPWPFVWLFLARVRQLEPVAMAA